MEYTEPRDFLLKWFRRLASELAKSADQEASAAEEPVAMARQKRSWSLWLAELLNNLYPPLFWAGIAFVLWLLVDFVLEKAVTPEIYGRIVRVSRPVEAIVGPATVGFWTNYLAIKMLFHPRRKNAVWHGLIPARRAELIETLAQGVNDNLFSGAIARRYLQESGLLQGLISRLAGAVGSLTTDSEFRRELKELMRGWLAEVVAKPEVRAAVREMTAGIVRDWTASNLLEKPIQWSKGIWGPWVEGQVVKALGAIPGAVDDFLPQVETVLRQLPGSIVGESGPIEAAAVEIVETGLHVLDVAAIIRSQLDKMDEAELERLLTSSVDTEMTFIQTSGGLFGLIVALAVIYPVLRLVFLAGGVAVWAIYRATVKDRKS